MSIKTFPIVLENSWMLTPRVKHFIFRSQQDPAFQFSPGQFITIHFQHENKTLRRSYSIANVPKENNQIEFAAGYVESGPGTALLFNLKPGDQIQMNGPFGRLVLKEEIPKRYIFAATSTGVTPYRSMLCELKNRLTMNPNLNVVILQGVQKREDLLYPNEFIAFAEQYPQQVSFRAHLSQASPTNLRPYEYCGYVQHAFSELNLNPLEDTIYLCGNPAMIDDSFTRLKEEYGFAMQQVIREKYISR